MLWREGRACSTITAHLVHEHSHAPSGRGHPINATDQFGNVAKGLARNPLGIIALFIVLVYGLACMVTAFGGSFTPGERMPLIYFLVVFPCLVLGAFTWLVSQHTASSLPLRISRTSQIT